MKKVHEELLCLYKTFLQDVLVDHNIENVMAAIADDIIGIGMGDQGVVFSKADVARILNGSKPDKASLPTITYENMQIRCYESSYATLCGVLKIRTPSNGKLIESSLGQLMNLRRENGKWLIYTLQATPLFDGIEEMEAYPIKFAENILETYRQQEQIARNALANSTGVYKINFTNDYFEDSVIKKDWVLHTEYGQA